MAAVTSAESADIRNRFGFHRATDKGTVSRHAFVRDTFAKTAEDLIPCVPHGRERSLMLTALEEASFWAHAGIARMTEDGERKQPETYEQALVPSVPDPAPAGWASFSPNGPASEGRLPVTGYIFPTREDAEAYAVAETGRTGLISPVEAKPWTVH